MNTDACKPVGEGADAPNVRLHRKEQDMSKQEATRLAFDRWCQDNGHGTLDDMVSPLDRSLRALMWSAWQAARRWPDGEPVAQRVPNRRGRHDYWDYGETYNVALTPENLYTAPPAESEPNLGMYKDAIKQVRGLQERIAALEAALEQARVAMKALRSVDAHSALTEDDADTINANLDAALRAIEEVRRG